MKQLKDGDIDEIIAKINTRPRKRFNFQLQLSCAITTDSLH